MIRFRPFQSWIGVHRRRRRHGRWRRRRSRGWCETAFGFPCLGIGIFWSRWKEIPWKMDSRETNRKGEFQFQFQATKKKKWEWVNIIRQCYLDVSVVVLWFHLPFCQFVKPKKLWFLRCPKSIYENNGFCLSFSFIYTFRALANLPSVRRRLIFI